ncbi:MAG: HD domain-containing protein [Bacteroidales bacterium]
MQLASTINKIEAFWFPKLLPFLEKLFNEQPIPSHDHLHHIRTWTHAKRLLNTIAKENAISTDLPEKLLIACLFHDTGLTINIDEKHGEAGVEICRSFFSTPPISEEAFNDILEAIKNHDNKQYKEIRQSPAELFTILTTADDLDAFGALGIVRYIEIYSMRGIKLPMLARKANKNLQRRFTHFMQQYGHYTELAAYYKEKAAYGTKLLERLTNREDTEAQKLYQQINYEILSQSSLQIRSPKTTDSETTRIFLERVAKDAALNKLFERFKD